MSAKLFKLPCKKTELRLDITLQCGQSFRWREVAPGKWRGVIGKYIWTLLQDDNNIMYEIHGASDQNFSNGENNASKCKKLKTSVVKEDFIINGNIPQQDECMKKKYDSILADYFQLNVSLEKMYSIWSKADSNFAAVSPQFPGVRMLNQDPVENVFSFICSSNNNIQRISMLVEKLCTLYGTPLATVDGTVWHAFPSVSLLAAQGVENTLRNHGFGYRAKYIQKSAEMIVEKGGDTWLHSLRSLPYRECHSQLMTLSGIGAKVSDCICLMSMGHLNAIPVDTHVFQIAVRDYLPHLSSCKTVTDRVYKEIADHFRDVFGEYAGWAHSVLFSADLRKFDGLKENVKKNPKTKMSTKTKNKKGR